MAQAMITEAVSEKTQKTTIDGVQIVVNYANDEDARVRTRCAPTSSAVTRSIPTACSRP